MLDIETIIIQSLIFNLDYFERIIPYLDYKLFDSFPHKYIAHTIQKYYKEYQRQLTYDILGVRIQNIENISQENHKLIIDLYNRLTASQNSNIDNIVKETEIYFKQRKIWLVISKGIEDYDKNKDFSPEFLTNAEDAITYSFDKSIGYNYFDNIAERMISYSTKENKIPMSLKSLNDCTNGGIKNKTLNAVISSTGGGKTVWLCQEAAFHYQNGRNVLYITLEMSEIEIAKRIDANILGIKQDILSVAYKDNEKDLVNKLKPNPGKLIIKEFPADCITSLDIKNIIEQIKRKEKIDIEVLIVDYLGILSSYRYSSKLNNSYAIGKHAAEELRSLAVQYNIPVWTAIQFNRGAENVESRATIGLDKVSDSYGIPMGLDFLFGILSFPQYESENKSYFRILKNRYGENRYGSTVGEFTVLRDWGASKFMDDPNKEVYGEEKEKPKPKKEVEPKKEDTIKEYKHTLSSTKGKTENIGNSEQEIADDVMDNI